MDVRHSRLFVLLRLLPLGWRGFIKSGHPLLHRVSPSPVLLQPRYDGLLLLRRSIDVPLPSPPHWLFPLPRRPRRFTPQNRPLRLRPGLHRQQGETVQTPEPFLFALGHQQIHPKGVQARDPTHTLPSTQSKDTITTVGTTPSVLRDLPTIISTFETSA